MMRSLAVLSGALVFVGCGGTEAPDPAERPGGLGTVQACDHRWTPTGSLDVPGYGPSATRLMNGKVLVMGGQSLQTGKPLEDAEVYDPGTGAWVPVAPMHEGRWGHGAALLGDGRVLVAGGSVSTGADSPHAEVYDPISNSWTRVADMSTSRYLPELVGLADGTVLAAGGQTSGSVVTPTAEVFHPDTNTWHSVGNMAVGQAFATVVLLLPDGRVLVAGGFSSVDDLGSFHAAQIFDPVSGIWSMTAPMSTGHYHPGGALLPSGRVLVAGGYSFPGYTKIAEIYDPATGTWTSTSAMAEDHYFPAFAGALSDGRVLIAGGITPRVEIYDEATGTWAEVASMGTPRWGSASALLQDGRVLVAGGFTSDSSSVSSSEVYQPCDLNQPPVAVCADRVVSAGPSCTASTSVNGGSYDPDHGPQPLVVTEAPGGPYSLGSRTVTLTASDGAATATCSASVTVVDDTPPEVNCPRDQVLECEGGSATGTFNATVLDNCSDVAATCPLSGQPLREGDNTVACSAADESGNQGSCHFMVTVRDSQPSAPGASKGLVLWPPNHKLRHVALSDCARDATDSCTGSISIDGHGRIVRVTSDEAADSTGDGHTGADIAITGATTVDLRAERAGTSDGRVYTIHYTVTDASGNSAAGACRVSVPHDQSGTPAADSGPHACAGQGC